MKTFKLLYIAAAALLFAACANEDEGLVGNGLVAATVLADKTTSINTRGTVDNSEWTVGDAIGVHVVSAGNTKGTNQKYVATDANGTFVAADEENTIYFKDNKEQVFSAYYPYIDQIEDEEGWVDWSIDYLKPEETLAKDFLFASGAVARKESPQVKFTNSDNGDHRFLHKMSMVKFVINEGPGVEGYYNEVKRIYLEKLIRKGVINVKTGVAATDGNSAERIEMVVNKMLDNEITCEFVLFPQTVTNNQLRIELVVEYDKDGSPTYNEYVATINLPREGFESGKKYIYNISVTNTGINIENASIMPWTEVDYGHIEAELE